MHTGMTGVDGTWYYMDSSGAMRTGWVSLVDGWHYFASNGAQMGGWLHDGGQWYYLDPNTGIMRTEPLEVGGRRYEFDASGAWRGYEAPAGYLQPTDHITGLGDATNTLTWGMNGTKVRIAQVRLGLWHSNKLASVDAPFVTAVKNFQQRAGLPVTGVVDKATWDAMYLGDDLIVHTDWMGRPARMQHITAGYGWDRMTADVVRPLP